MNFLEYLSALTKLSRPLNECKIKNLFVRAAKIIYTITSNMTPHIRFLLKILESMNIISP